MGQGHHVHQELQSISVDELLHIALFVGGREVERGVTTATAFTDIYVTGVLVLTKMDTTAPT